MSIKLVDICILLAALSHVFSLFGVLGIHLNKVSGEPEVSVTEVLSTNTPIPTPTLTPTPTPEVEEELPISEAFIVIQEINRKMGEIEIPCVRLVFEDEYRVFLTAYCAEECGWSYETSSGESCHRSDWINRYSEPSTCAIDLRYFPYGTMFYVPSEDRVYIAEDTGPGVRGMWIDTYWLDISDVYGYGSHYETVYTVSIEHYTVQASNYDVRHILLNNIMEGSK